MKYGIKIMNVVTVYVVIFFAIGMGFTFVSEYLIQIDWFGDKICDWKGWGTNYNNVSFHKHGEFYHYKGDVYLIWGSRHFWYFWALMTLSLVTLIRGVVHSSIIKKPVN
jgi:hypothetical protein